MATKGIPVGPSRWIEFIDLEGRYNEAQDVDAFLGGELSQLWDALETACVSDCCGLEAFSFFPGDIASAATGVDLVAVHGALSEAMCEIESLETTVVVSSRLNNLVDKRTFLSLLRHIRECLPVER